MSRKRELLFSVTKDDCNWDYFRAPGPGGQKKNKTESAVRCTHKKSGAVGQATESRSQHDNKQSAFVRMSQTKEFKQWHKMEVARKTGAYDAMLRDVEKQMKEIKVEIKDDCGLWTEVDKNDTLDKAYFPKARGTATVDFFSGISDTIFLYIDMDNMDTRSIAPKHFPIDQVEPGTVLPYDCSRNQKDELFHYVELNGSWITITL